MPPANHLQLYFLNQEGKKMTEFMRNNILEIKFETSYYNIMYTQKNRDFNFKGEI